MIKTAGVGGAAPAVRYDRRTPCDLAGRKVACNERSTRFVTAANGPEASNEIR